MVSSNVGLIGSALFYSGLQFALASCEMSSRFSVENFSVDQRTLQAAANALSTYFIIAAVWTAACCFVLYGDYGSKGIIAGFLSNALFVGWIVVSYWLTFGKAARTNNLIMPRWFGFSYSPSPIAREIAEGRSRS